MSVFCLGQQLLTNETDVRGKIELTVCQGVISTMPITFAKTKVFKGKLNLKNFILSQFRNNWAVSKTFSLSQGSIIPLSLSTFYYYENTSIHSGKKKQANLKTSTWLFRQIVFY